MSWAPANERLEVARRFRNAADELVHAVECLDGTSASERRLIEAKTNLREIEGRVIAVILSGEGSTSSVDPFAETSAPED